MTEPHAASAAGSKPEGSDNEPTLESLQAQLEESSREAERLKSEKEQWMQAALRGQPAPAPPTQPAQKTASRQPLPPRPDREKDPEAYEQWLDSSLRRLDSETHALNERIEREETTARQRESENAMWERFKKTNPDLADHQDLVALAFSLETGGTGQFREPEPLFFKRVAERTRNLGTRFTPAPKAEDDEPAPGHEQPGFVPPPGSPPPAASPSTPANRTAGVGASTRVKSPAKKPTTEKPPKSFSEELADLQAQSGYF